MKTRNQWEEKLRKVKPREQPAGFLTVRYQVKVHHDEVGSDGSVTTATTKEIKERQVPLYRFDQTTPYRRRCPAVYLTLYRSYFVCGRKQYIWWAKDHWVTCAGYLNNKQIKAHVQGKEIYGVRAGEDAMTNYVVIDLDLHNGSKEVFARQLDVLMDHFHGAQRTHYSYGKHGVHIIVMLDRPTLIDQARAWLRDELQKLDTEELKELAAQGNMRAIADLEIKPSRKDGWRLPFARNRVTYTDRPLVGNDWKTFAEYVDWLVGPTYADKEIVYQAILDHTEEEPRTEQKKPKSAPKTAKKEKDKADVVPGSLGRMKGRYRKVLSEFWSGRVTPGDTLNTAILLTARMLPQYSDDPEEAIDYIEELVDALPDTSFSDRLSSGNRKEVSRIIANTVAKVYDGNGGQPRVEESSGKLKTTKEVWDRIGFSLLDKSTWSRSSSGLGEKFSFGVEHMQALSYLASILKTDLATCMEITRQIIRVVHTQRELAVAYFEKLIKSFGISARHDGRVNEYVNTLCQLGWIIAIKPACEGRGRTFIAGNEFYKLLAGANSNFSSTTRNTTHETIFCIPFRESWSTLESELSAVMRPNRAKPPPLAEIAPPNCERRAKKPAPGRLKRLAPDVVCVV